MDEWVERLKAQLDEDERLANEEDEDFADTTLLPNYDSKHQARWTTDRVRTEVDALRRLVIAYETFDALGAAAAARLDAGNEAARVDWLTATARAGALKDALLALSKARYPDLQEQRP